MVSRIQYIAVISCGNLLRVKENNNIGGEVSLLGAKKLFVLELKVSN